MSLDNNAEVKPLQDITKPLKKSAFLKTIKNCKVCQSNTNDVKVYLQLPCKKKGEVEQVGVCKVHWPQLAKTTLGW